MEPFIEGFFDEATFTVSYLLADPATKRAAIIDPVLDFDPASGSVSTKGADAILARAADMGLSVEMVLETHAHADHLTAAPWIKQQTGAWVGIGEHIRDVQKIFRPRFNMTGMEPDGAEFDRLFADGETIMLGQLTIEAMHLPGHTPADLAYKVGGHVFTGDSVFMPDYGTARADFPGGDARTLYRSIRKLLTLPDETRLYHCHDYKAPDRDEYRWESTIGDHRRANVHAHDGVSEDEFVAMREVRDAQLAAPRLILPSIQVNIRAGHFPEAEDNGVTYLKIPVTRKDG